MRDAADRMNDFLTGADTGEKEVPVATESGVATRVAAKSPGRAIN